MQSLKELYRIGAGPSSSHTMGPQKASLFMKNKYLNADRYEVVLCGSLALTGVGHLTDYIIKKTLGEDITNIVFDLNKKIEHPNTMYIKAFYKENLLAEQEFVSIGGGALIIKGQEESEAKEVYTFKDFQEIKEYLNKNNLTLQEFVYEHEDEDIKYYLEEVYNTMKNAVNHGLVSSGVLPGRLKVERKAPFLAMPKSNDEEPEITQKRIISSYAYAVSEENASGGIIVTAPTCGSCGVLPAVLIYLENKYHYSLNQMLDALAVASVFGNIIKQNASISGAYAGCQSEIGSACSMAAAAASFLRGGTLDEIEYAAEIAMEHFLGLTCDPIDGLVQIPCIERNAVAALRAVDSQVLASFLGKSNKINFDTVVKTMLETGKDLPHAYKETSIGGLANHYNC